MLVHDVRSEGSIRGLIRGLKMRRVTFIGVAFVAYAPAILRGQQPTITPAEAIRRGAARPGGAPYVPVTPPPRTMPPLNQTNPDKYNVPPKMPPICPNCGRELSLTQANLYQCPVCKSQFGNSTNGPLPQLYRSNGPRPIENRPVQRPVGPIRVHPRPSAIYNYYVYAPYYIGYPLQDDPGWVPADRGDRADWPARTEEYGPPVPLSAIDDHVLDGKWGTADPDGYFHCLYRGCRGERLYHRGGPEFLCNRCGRYYYEDREGKLRPHGKKDSNKNRDPWKGPDPWHPQGAAAPPAIQPGQQNIARWDEDSFWKGEKYDSAIYEVR